MYEEEIKNDYRRGFRDGIIDSRKIYETIDSKNMSKSALEL